MKRKNLLAGFFGNILEWYDFTVYGFFAVIIGSLFFPSNDKMVSLIGAFGVFAAGYFMRPLGGLLFGHIGDKYGRKKALIISIALMGIPTTLIGLLPTYSQIGWYAALMLVILRLAQGLSVGGEFTGSISFLFEHAPRGKGGYFGSWTTFGVIGGMLLGAFITSLVSGILSQQQLYQFGWRIPFLLGAVIGVAGIMLRKNMKDEIRILENISPVHEFWHSYKKKALAIILIAWGFGVSVYLILIYMPTYMHVLLEILLSTALSIHTFSLIVLMLLIPPLGIFADKIGKRVVLLLALAGFIFFSAPLFYVISLNIYVAIILAMLIFILVEAMLQAALPAFMAEIFPKRVRYTSMSVSYNIALALFGGTAPLMATWLVKTTGNIFMPAYYLIFSTGISFLTLLIIKRNKKISLVNI